MAERLFAIEKGLESMPSDGIYKVRLEKSKPVLNECWNLLSEIDAVGSCVLAKAAGYSIKNKATLEGFLLDGRLRQTNNRAAREVKTFVVVGKNWLLSDA